MIRSTVPVWLTLVTVVLAGCSNRHVVDLAQLKQQRLAAAEASSQRSKTPPRQGKVSPPAVTSDDPVTTATIGRTRQIRPWPKVGTPEWHQLEAEAAERERRILEAVHSICRGC